MANEISVTTKLTLTNVAYKETFDPGVIRVTQSAIGGHAPVLSIGTSEEVISAGDVTTLGWLCLQNLDTTNYVEVGPESGGALVGFLRLKAGESAMMRLKPGITIRAQANTAAVKVKMLLLQD